MREYKEILELHRYCQKTGVQAVLEHFIDGYAIRFLSGGDFVQHQYSYGSKYGYVEPAIGCRSDYSAVSLKDAKRLVYRHKKKLNCERKDGADNE